MRQPTLIRRHSLSHAILLALVREPMEPERLHAHGQLFGKPHAVNVAVQRLRKRGLLEVQAKITDKGLAHLRRSGE